MSYYTFYERECEGRLKVAKTEEDGYTFATAEYDALGSRSSFLVFDRGEVEALVSVLTELLDTAPTA